MNSLHGKITKVETEGELSLVTVTIGEIRFKSIVIETPQSENWLKEGSPIRILFKETEVVIGRNPDDAISLRNRMHCKIEKIEMGKLLSKLTLYHPEGRITSVITSGAVADLALLEGEEVIAMIKTNEIMLAQV